MPHIYAQVRIPHRSLVTQDDVMNTFHFTGIDDVEDMCTAILGRLATFWNTIPGGGTRPLKNWYSGEFRFEGARVKMYDWADPEPRVPVFDESLGISAAAPAATGNLPSEIALCTSYLAAPESGERPARRRGRLYLGPFNTAALTGTGDLAARPTTQLIGDAYRATRDLAAANTLGAQWVVWSRVGGIAAEIERGYVDNAFDTQRRRGVESTARTSWEVEI